jgi:putative ABC transport system permease protein
MLKIALKGLWARKLRTVLTGFAVVLGVAFVAGTFVFTDTIDASFKDLFERAQKGTDVTVTAKVAVEEDFAAPPTMPSSALDRVKSVDGVDAAQGNVSSDGNLLDKQGKPIVSNGPPTLLLSSGEKRFDPLTYREGGPPQSDGEVVLDRGTAEKYGFKVGDTVTVSGRAPKKQYKVSGIATLGDSDNLAGSRMVLMTLPEAQRMSGHDGFDDISVAAAGGRRRRRSRRRSRASWGPSTPCAPARSRPRSRRRTSPTRSASSAPRCSCSPPSRCSSALPDLQHVLVTVAQRTKEFALLRTIGASRGQVLRSVLAETFVIGVIASLIGIACGLRSRPASPRCCRRSGSTSGPRARCSSRDDDRRPASSASSPRSSRASCRPAAPRGSSRSRRCATASRRPRAACAAADRGAVVVEALGVVAAALRPVRRPGDAAATALVSALGSVLMIFGFALLAPTLVRPLSG